MKSTSKKPIIVPQSLLNSDEAREVNFREIRAGTIAPATLYRSSHPIKDNKQEKAVSLLAAETHITSVVNLADTGAELSIKAFFAPWYNKLLLKNRVIALGMDFSNSGASFNLKLKKALRFIVNTEGPWLLHCYAGVDRTGFVSIVLEAFMGAGIDEIISDYMESFNSGFGSAVYGDENASGKYIVMKQLSVMSDALVITDENLQGIAELYLRNTIGLTRADTEALKRKLASPPPPGAVITPSAG